MKSRHEHRLVVLQATTGLLGGFSKSSSLLAQLRLAISTNAVRPLISQGMAMAYKLHVAPACPSEAMVGPPSQTTIGCRAPATRPVARSHGLIRLLKLTFGCEGPVPFGRVVPVTPQTRRTSLMRLGRDSQALRILRWGCACEIMKGIELTLQRRCIRVMQCAATRPASSFSATKASRIETWQGCH